jgi:hypothetical protein
MVLTGEDKLQAEVIYLTKKLFPNLIIFSHLEGTDLSQCKNKWQLINKSKQMGQLKGVPDLQVLMPEGKTIYLEAKVGTNIQSKEQIEFEQKAKGLGHNYHVFYSKERVINILLDSLNLDYDYVRELSISGVEEFIEQLKKDKNKLN